MITTAELFKNAYDGAYYTITGAGGRIEDWKEGYDKLLQERGIGKASAWYQFTGKDMNEHYHLTGNNRYPDDLTFLCFPLDGLHVGRLAFFKMAMRDRWFNDIVDNDARREAEK